MKEKDANFLTLEDANFKNLRDELKELYEILMPLEKKNPELYAKVIEELRIKIADVKHRMVSYMLKEKTKDIIVGGR